MYMYKDTRLAPSLARTVHTHTVYSNLRYAGTVSAQRRTGSGGWWATVRQSSKTATLLRGRKATPSIYRDD